MRSPAFAKGPYFGTVPHTRVIIFGPTATGPAAFLNNGVVIGYSHESGEGDGDWFYEWAGAGEAGGHTWTVRYFWTGMILATGAAQFNIQVESSTGGGFAAYSDTYTTITPSENFSIPKIVETPSGRFGDHMSKVEVPEWSNVLDRWPSAIGFEPA